MDYLEGKLGRLKDLPTPRLTRIKVGCHREVYTRARTGITLVCEHTWKRNVSQFVSRSVVYPVKHLYVHITP